MTMQRRSFISLLGGAASAWPMEAKAQQRTAMPIIGFLHSASPDQSVDRLRAFRQGLSDTGHVEGRNVGIEYRWGEGHNDRLPALAADLVRRQVAVIAATDGIPGALAAKAATTTIPIVFRTGANPVESGLVVSLNRPGGNVTGVTSLNVQVGPKRLELLHELVPAARIVALLVNSTIPAVVVTDIVSRALQAARILGLHLHVLYASTEGEIEAAFAVLVQVRAAGLVITSDVFFTSQTKQFVTLSLRHAIPTIYQFREFAAAGGLMSYGSSLTDSYRLAGEYTGQILKGAKPADLPVQQSTRIELFINMKTAKAFGLTMPTALLVRADEVIE
jgi:putative ABC transport system substrate-binding protein